ncbi:PREDICTED: E3 ubiquitin-protein ligase RNF216-like [Nicrophorus vespilloides]|uniref:E3 ubiquitin-protein ligase RNF216-like n=1 Tax=Nicrophorus vespilloides TaxID=110193 RepID=A0ABM1M879_NICVS|nr:PREDICTED: E3 ubiquitin-protein ligase RNF216-like [Nicrophorus vespilloides]
MENIDINMENDIRNIQRCLSDVNSDIIIKYLLKHKNDENRMMLAMRDYFRDFDDVDQFVIDQEAVMLSRMFPFANIQVLVDLLERLGNEPNRLRIAMRKILQEPELINQNLRCTSTVTNMDQSYGNGEEFQSNDDDDEEADSKANLQNLRHSVEYHHRTINVNKRKLDEHHDEVPVLPKRHSTDATQIENIPSTSNDHTYNFPLHFQHLIRDVARNKREFVGVNEIISISDSETANDVIDITDDIQMDEVVAIEVPVAEIHKPETLTNAVEDIIPQPVNMILYNSISSVFPDAEPEFLKHFCISQQYNETIASGIINTILAMPNYPLRKVIVKEEHQEQQLELMDEDSQFEMLKQILPKADPTYLRDKIGTFKTVNDFQSFITEALDKHQYPTLEEYERKNRAFAQLKKYTSEFNVQCFVENIPNVEEYFQEMNKKLLLYDPRHERDIIDFLKNKYRNISVKNIALFKHESTTIFEVCQKLDNCRKTLKTKRSLCPLEHIRDIPLLQMFAYMTHRKEIMNYIYTMKEKKENQRILAKELNLWVTCQCCYDEEIMPEDVVNCASGCICCSTCAQRSIEIAFGEGKLDYPCLSDCGIMFPFQYIQTFLSPKLFSKIALKKQVQEVKAAELEGVEQCPFCDFMTIPPSTDKIFKCLNPDCLKESCRQCNELSHIPLRCDEIEKDEEVKNRVYIENKMTEALIRKCWKCHTKFIKSDGCNKMTCVCGATMCYICNKPVTDYKHFNGQGGHNTHLCPLYSDTNKLHEHAVRSVAKKAKAEVGQSLKIDPTTNIHQYYKEYNQNNPQTIPPGMLFNMH